MPEAITLKREDLYAQAWSTPMTQLAKKYGLSDRGLAKACQKLEVPVPSRGYWARKQNGKSVKQVALPSLSAKGKTEYTLSGIKYESPPKKSTHLEPEVLEGLRAQLKDICVPNRLEKPHPLVEQFQEVAAKGPPKRKGLWTPDLWSVDKGRYVSKRDQLDILVSPERFDRALRIMDTIFKCVESLGEKVFIPVDSFSTVIRIQEEDFHVSLVEKYGMEKLPPKDSWSKYELKYHPNGILEFRVKDGNYSPKCWKDGKRKRLEDQIDEIIIAFYEEVKRREIRRVEVEKERIRAAEEAERRWVEERRQQMEQEAIKDLEAKALNWEKANRIRAYLDQVVKQYEGNEEARKNEEFQKWLKWGYEYAERLGPSAGFEFHLVSKFEKESPTLFFCGAVLISASCKDFSVGLNDETQETLDCLARSGCDDETTSSEEESGDDSSDPNAVSPDGEAEDTGDLSDSTGGIEILPISRKGSNRYFMGTYEESSVGYPIACQSSYGNAYDLPGVLRLYSYGDIIDFEDNFGNLVWVATVYPDDTFDFMMTLLDSFGRPSNTVACTCYIEEYLYGNEKIKCSCDPSYEGDVSCSLTYGMM